MSGKRNFKKMKNFLSDSKYLSKSFVEKSRTTYTLVLKCDYQDQV